MSATHCDGIMQMNISLIFDYLSRNGILGRRMAKKSAWSWLNVTILKEKKLSALLGNNNFSEICRLMWQDSKEFHDEKFIQSIARCCCFIHTYVENKFSEELNESVIFILLNLFKKKIFPLRQKCLCSKSDLNFHLFFPFNSFSVVLLSLRHGKKKSHKTPTESYYANIEL